MTSNVVSAGFVTRALTLAIIWYLCFALNLLPILRYHLVEIISSYTFSSERFFMEEVQNGTFTTLFHDILSPIRITVLVP